MADVVDAYAFVLAALALAAVVCVSASWTAAWRHLGAQLAALRGPCGIAALVWTVPGLALGAWPLAACSAGIGAVAFVPTAPAACRRLGSRPVESVSLITANVLVHNDRFVAAIDELLARDGDIIVLQEVTPAHAHALGGVIDGRTDFHLIAEPRDDYSGWATLSRHPVSSSGRIDFPGWPVSWTMIALPSGPIRVVNVHAAAPQTPSDVEIWERQFESLAEFAGDSIRSVLAGDFNATNDHSAFRRLLDSGYRDAFSEAGRGWGATWPVHRFLPTLLRLDHVLVDERIGVSRIDTIEVTGSDHRGLLAVLEPRATTGRSRASSKSTRRFALVTGQRSECADAT